MTASPGHRRRDARAARGRLFGTLIGDPRSTATLAIASVLSALCEAGILAIAAQAATALVDGQTRLRGSLGLVHVDVTVRLLLWTGVGLALLRLALQYFTSYLPGKISADAQATMRRRLLRSYVTASWQLQSQDLEGHFQELMTNQIAQASAGSVQMTLLITSGCTFAILVVSAFALNFFAALAVFAAAVLLFGALRPLNSLGTRMARQTSSSQLDYAGSVGEANRVTEEAGVFGVLRRLSERVDGFIAIARTSYMRTQIVARAVPNIYQSMIYIVLVVGLLTVTLAHVRGFSTLGAVVLLLVRAGTYGQQLQTSYVLVRQALPYVERLDDAQNAYLASAPESGDTALGKIESITFDSVSYSYRPDRPVLRDLSFDIKGGETVGVVGPSGAGKSTILQVLLRLRDPTSGRFMVNGTLARELAFEAWHDRVSYVPQQPKLLHGSVTDNVRFFRDFDRQAVERACRQARIHDEIIGWPDGYDTVVGPRADAVSGGQQQRICLARALVSDPSLLVLDEPTSALDPRSESLIQQSLEALQDKLTLVIIAHRMSTLTICDRIMVVLNGSLDAFAGLDELESSNHYYRYASGLDSPTLPAAPQSDDTAPRDDRQPDRLSTHTASWRVHSGADAHDGPRSFGPWRWRPSDTDIDGVNS